MPKISVITGAYNCAQTLPVAVRSIVAQTFTDWEMIICDDCSGDDTLAVAMALAREDERIKVIRNKQNRGLAFSLNHCLEEARGEYVARMDTDDIASPDRFAIQAAFLDQNPGYAVVGGGVRLFGDDGEREVLLNPEVPDVRMLKRRIPFFHPTIMMRKQVYDALGGYTVSWRTQRGQDLDMWFRFFARGYKGYNLQQPVLMYHDDIMDYGKKRSFRIARGTSATLLAGFRANHFPVYLYPYVLVPVISYLIPRRLLFELHKRVTVKSMRK